jgi:hypothetical protein
MKTKLYFTGFAAIAILGIFIAAIIGWVMNVIAIVGALSGPITAMFIARCVGVFAAPVGAILGYF